MPTTYTHYRFGNQVLKHLPGRIQKEIGEYMNEYNIGLHGPDVLFYYHAFHKNKVNQYGVHVHDEPMKDFLERAFRVYSNAKDQKRAFAYLAGMMTHFYLDSTCHPYIKKRMKETGLSHTEIETELDAILMGHDHYDPIRHKTASHLSFCPKTAKAIAPFFELKTVRMLTSIIHMRFILNHVFRSPWGVKRNGVILANRFFLKKHSFEHYYVHKKRNRDNRDTIRELLHIYKEDLPLCADEICKLRAALMSMDESYVDQAIFLNNFAG